MHTHTYAHIHTKRSCSGADCSGADCRGAVFAVGLKAHKGVTLGHIVTEFICATGFSFHLLHFSLAAKFCYSSRFVLIHSNYLQHWQAFATSPYLTRSFDFISFLKTSFKRRRSDPRVFFVVVVELPVRYAMYVTEPAQAVLLELDQYPEYLGAV